MTPLKIVIIGAGAHSRANHLPALARYVAQHPGEVELTALCDLRPDHAATVAARFGFQRVYTDLHAMLDWERPDGCIAVTPIPITAEVATAVMRTGVPLLMEKPRPPSLTRRGATIGRDLSPHCPGDNELTLGWETGYRIAERARRPLSLNLPGWALPLAPG